MGEATGWQGDRQANGLPGFDGESATIGCSSGGVRLFPDAYPRKVRQWGTKLT